MRAVILVMLSLIVGGIFSFISCSKDQKGKEASHQEMAEHEMPVDWKFTLPKGDPVEGRKVFADMQCYKCHEVKGETFPAMSKEEKGVGPELFQMARIHPVEYFAESIINPNAVIYPGGKEKGYLGDDGKSKMPNYSDLLTVKQLADLATYLASLEGEKHAGH